MSETLAERNTKDNLYSRNISLEQLVADAIADWKIDLEEASKLQRKFIYEKECLKENNDNCKIELKRETAQKLLDLASKWWFTTLVAKIQERFEWLKTPESNIYTFFWIPKTAIDGIDKKCSEYWINFNISWFLNWYKEYFQKNLSWLDESITQKIKEVIKIKLFKINEIIDERIKFVDEQIRKWNYKLSDRKNEIKNQRWIINSKLQENFSALNNTVLPWAALLLKSENWTIVNPYAWRWYLDTIWWKVYEMKNMFDSKVNEEGDFDSLYHLKYNPNRVLDLSNDMQKNIWKDNNINIKAIPSILSEKDKEIETQAQMYFMAAVWAQIAVEMWPAAALSIFPGFWTALWAMWWAAVWWVIDVADMFSDTEVLLEMVQKMWFVDPNYRMDKTIIDNILAWVWILPWMTALVKWKALWEFLRKLPPDKQWKFDETMFKILDKVRPKNIEKIGDISYEISKRRLIIHEIWENVSRDDLLKIINILKDENVWITKIDISKIKDEKMASEAKKLLNDILSENFSALSIERLIDWQRVVDISFSWWKHLNDYVSKEFCDLVVAKFKDKIRQKVKEAWTPPNHREVRSDYKHHTVTFGPDEDFTKLLFWNSPDRKSFLKEVLWDINDSDLAEIFNIIKKDVDADKKLKHLWLNKESSINDLRKALLKEVEENFDYWIWTSVVKWGDFDEKAKAFYEAETSAKRWVETWKVEAREFSFERVKGFAEKALSIEEDLVKNFKGQFIEIWWEFHKVIVTNHRTWESLINPILLRYIRKDWEIWDKNLQVLVKQYIWALNEWFDFISPMVKWVEKDTKILNDSVREWIVDVENITHSNKWTYTRKALQTEIEWKDWTRAFVDIVDMWIMNLMDFRELAKKVRKWEITQDKMMELLDAWWSVTATFQQFVKWLEKHWIKLSLGWDEVFMYSEKLSPDKLSKIIAENLEQTWLRWRVTFSTDVKDSKKIFDKLDSDTWQIKPIEQLIEWTILNEPELVKKGIWVPSSIMLRVKDWVQIPEWISKLINKEKILELYEKWVSNISEKISLTRINNQITLNIN